MVSAVQAQQFWAVVEECLVELADMPRKKAGMAVSRLKVHLASQLKPRPGEPDFTDLIYHAEPLRIASDIAGRELVAGKAAQLKYDEIRDRHLCPATVSRNEAVR